MRTQKTTAERNITKVPKEDRRTITIEAESILTEIDEKTDTKEASRAKEAIIPITIKVLEEQETTIINNEIIMIDKTHSEESILRSAIINKLYQSTL